MLEQNGYEATRVTGPEPLELTDEMIERNDDIDNAVYHCILTLAEKDVDELPWSMEIIGDVTDAIKETLSRHNIMVRHPAVVTEPDGKQHYEEYERTEERGKMPEIRFDGAIYRGKEGIDTLVEPWFDADEKLPFPIPQDPDTSSVFFYALYNPNDGSMKYLCRVEYDKGVVPERIHEFELTETEISLLKEGMEALCQKENQCSLEDYWKMYQKG